MGEFLCACSIPFEKKDTFEFWIITLTNNLQLEFKKLVLCFYIRNLVIKIQEIACGRSCE